MHILNRMGCNVIYLGVHLNTMNIVAHTRNTPYILVQYYISLHYA